MSSSWYFVREGQRVGPMRREELDAQVAEGALNGDTLVWRVGMAAWARACELPELGVPPAVPPPPLPAAGWVPPPPAHAAPRAADSGRAAPRKLAGFGVRLGAKAIDLILLAGVGQGVEWAVTRWVFEGALPVPPDWAGFLRGLLWILSINTLVAMLYTVYFVTRYEATPGKRLLGLRVVRADGGRLGGLKSFGRFWGEQVTGLTFFAGYVMAAFDQEKRALHDFICDTRVVKGEREEE
jgi:uncharacterized RDD family membrane protein YckC